MTTTRRRTVAATLTATATALLAVLLPAPPAGAAAPPTAPLAWGPCAGEGLDPRQECATLRVPLDYRNPGGRQISLAVSRLRSEHPGKRRGSLLLIPGGPGGSGLNGPSTAARGLPRQVRDAYDIIGFDPRGVGRSTPVGCDLAHADLAPVRLLPWPSPGGGIEGNTAAARRIADACAENGGPVLRSITTANEARDIDSIRHALGERRISAWGVSYGAYAGAVYAQLFPHRTDRIVLDSAGDPDPRRVVRGWLANQAVGVADSFPVFARWASDPGNPHRLAGTPRQVRALFLGLARRLDREPVPWPGANPAELNGNVLRQALLDGLYSTDRFPALARLIEAARGGGPLPAPPTAPEEVVQNTTAASAATICNDVAWPTDPAGYARDVAVSRLRHPLTAGMPVNITPCAFWHDRPQEPPVRITSRGPSNILLVQNLRDPATPHHGALRMRRALGDRVRMVTVDETGHVSYTRNGNACGDALVTGFLTTGDRPSHDTFCPASGG
ncbi:alpha/beta hydrolase [Streptomyces sp. TRM 70361]|uniref:alpha/beta hydrolase n=1 Tax=Streptomyces sp. TRM 70361 TaxID=3116553 RepID=UPI002E7B9423|nr:alpha/beta hydrolase [Streptomyces sp. TRM 70361]MEE1942411.1 alpha/beta hydrolase [Streptomyces sp. TRM 70361]